MMKWIRHGDVILEVVDRKLAGSRKNRIVLAEGEVTGHKHVLSGLLQECFVDGERYVCVMGDAQLTHQEHETLLIPEGSYRVVMQREVDLLGEVRQVMD